MSNPESSTRECLGCGNEWPLTRFYWRKNPKNPQGLNRRCKVCVAAPNRKDRVLAELFAGEHHKVCSVCEVPKPRTTEFFKARYDTAGGLHYACKECCNARQVELYQEDPERHREYVRAYRERYPEKVLEDTRRYHEENHEKRLAYNRWYNEQYREKKLEYKRQYREENREQINADARERYQRKRESRLQYNAEYRKANRHYFKRKAYERRMLEEAAGEMASEEELAQMLEDQQHQCAYCLVALTQKNTTVDHMIPLSRGGDNDALNLCICCSTCNSSKRSLTAVEYMERLRAM